MKLKGLPIPNVWVDCRLQVIDETVDPPRWETIWQCIWTPNEINKALEELKKKGYCNIWVLGPDGRVPTF